MGGELRNEVGREGCICFSVQMTIVLALLTKKHINTCDMGLSYFSPRLRRLSSFFSTILPHFVGPYLSGTRVHIL